MEIPMPAARHQQVLHVIPQISVQTHNSATLVASVNQYQNLAPVLQNHPTLRLSQRVLIKTVGM